MTTKSNTSDQKFFVGVDFGTTKTMVAIYDETKKSARPITIGRGKFEMPTTIYKTKAGSVLFGDEADDEGISDGLNHIRCFKMKLGNPTWKHAGRKSGTAQQLTREFLDNLRKLLENTVLHQSLDRIVLTVPAMFGPAQRRDLTDAAHEAGFTHVELLEEPVAAGIAYCDQRGDLSKQLRFIVVDWGGGTFDVAHLEKTVSGEIKVHEDFVVGLDDIGGEVFDSELWNIAINALSSTGQGTISYQNYGRYRRDLSRAKETLSSQKLVTMTFTLDDGKTAKITLEQNDFNNIISPMIQKAASFVSQLIVRAYNAGCPPEFILLAGGTSRIPFIAEQFEKITGVKCRQWSDGREAIALGAAIKATQLWQCHNRRIDQEGQNTAIEKMTAMMQYRKLLEAAFLDGKITSAERVFLEKEQKSLALTIEESRSLQIQVLGLPIDEVNIDCSEQATNSSAESAYSTRKFMCPNRHCAKEIVLTSKEMAGSTYSCPYCNSPIFTQTTASENNKEKPIVIDPNSIKSHKDNTFEIRLEKSDIGLQIVALAPEAHPDLQGDDFIIKTHFPMAYLVTLENVSIAKVHSVRVVLKSCEGHQHSILIPSVLPGKSGALTLTSIDFEGWMVTAGDSLTVDAIGLSETTFEVTEERCAAVDQQKALKEDAPCLVIVRKATLSSNFVLKVINLRKNKIKITGFESPAGSISEPIEIEPDGNAEIGWCELSEGRNLAAGEQFLMKIQGFRHVQGVIAEGKLKGSGAIWTTLGAIGGIALAVAGA